MKKLIFSTIFLLFIGCGSNTTTPKEQNLETNGTEEDNSTISEIHDDNRTIESNLTLEENVTVVYSDDETTLEADSRYARNNAESSAKILSLLFKGTLPLKNNIPIVKVDHNFTIELNWQNPEYAKNVNYYFFNGTQQSIQYLSFPLTEGVSSYKIGCKMLGSYHYKCGRFEVDDSQFYVGRTLPIRSSFVMSLCDRSTQDPNRICDFIRIPVELEGK